MSLKQLDMEQKSCSRCNICKWIPIEKYKRFETQAICPALEHYQFHAFSAAGKQHMSVGINDEAIAWDESVADVTYKCLFCGGCEFSCKAYRKDMDLSDTFDALREGCVERGLLPEPMKTMMENLSSEDDCYGRKKEEKIDWAAGTGVKSVAENKTGTAFLYAGAIAQYDRAVADKTAAVAKLLIKKGCDLVAAGIEEANSGYEAFVLGDIERGKKCAERVKEQVEASGASQIIVMDAHSFGVMRNYYPKYGYDLGVEVLHITQVLDQMISEGIITFANSADLKVTYHDPCYLGRRSDPYKPPFEGMKDMRPVAASRTGELGIYDAPRNIIRAIKGISLIEMDRIEGYAWCCGGAAGIRETYPELTESTSAARMEEAALTGAEYLVTACPVCEYTLKAASKGMKIVDLLDLVLTIGGAQ